MPADPATLYEAHTLEHDDNGDAATLPYRLLKPKTIEDGKRYPLVVFLHGAGERGGDNERQLLHPDVLNFATAKYAAANPAFLVAPQCPAGQKWVDVNWWQKPHHKTPEKPAESMRLTLELMDALAEEFPIDPDRVYVTGLSMGGYGTFDALVRRPGYWAAAVPLCGGADDARAKDFAQVPIWVFHGSKAANRSGIRAARSQEPKPPIERPVR